MAGIPFNAQTPDLEAVRQIIFERLRREPQWNQVDRSGDGYAPYVEYKGSSRDGRNVLIFSAQDVFWRLIIEGILSPGINSMSLDLPWFHVTAYGKQVLLSGPANPHDPSGYLRRLREKVSQPDSTVMAYLTESLNSFLHGDHVASTVMLGIAAERVFLLLCESLLKALRDANEQKAFSKIMERFPMKPKLDWVHQKVQALPRNVPLPENTNIMVITIYDFVRNQRNDLGHPREQPPKVTQEQAYGHLQIFPGYYQTAEDVRSFLAANAI